MFGVFRRNVISGSSSASIIGKSWRRTRPVADCFTSEGEVLLHTRITDNVRSICHVIQPGVGVNIRPLREVITSLHPCVSMQLQNRVFSSDSVGRSEKLYSSSAPGDGDGDGDGDDFLPEKPELQVQGVDPRKGWGFRGVHKAIICGKVGQAPLQKILRNGRTVTIFTVGTGGMFDQRTLGAKDLPKPAQWHRIAVHNETLGAYAVQQLTKNSSVYVEGDIETRVYNDSINGEVKNIPEICICRDGKIRLFKTGESISSISFDELREGLI